MHKSLRWFIVFSQMAQFSDSKGQRFESPRPHQINIPRQRALP